MKKTVSVLLLMLMIFACVPLYVFAQGDEEQEEAVNCASLGAPIGLAESTEEYRKAVDGDADTFWQANVEGCFVGFNISKEKNVRLQSLSILVSLPEAEGGLEASYTVQYYRNGRWYDLFAFKDRDTVPDGFDSYAEAVASANPATASYTKTLDDELITQQIRVVVSGIEGSSAMPKIYELAAYGQVLENVAPKGKAYASTFKHFEWTPPSSANDRNDFDNDWHGWEPQYPLGTANKDTSAGFFGEYLGIEFVNREYYEISQLSFHMSMHNSHATPSMGYQNTKYTVEALCDGEWIVIAQFYDSDAVPRDYEDYDDAMANDTGEHHIPAYYTKTLSESVITNNIRVTIDEFAKNYQGNEELVFPFIYEMRAYGTAVDAPILVLPEGAEQSNDATSLSFPYASSSKYNKYPLLAVDDDKTTGWKPFSTEAGQTLGIKLNKTYTVNDVFVQFKDATVNEPFKVEALVGGEWLKLFDGNVRDSYNPEPGADQSYTYYFDSVTTDELRLVFTDSISIVPEILEISSNIVGSFATALKDVGAVEFTASDSAKNNGLKFGEAKKIIGLSVDFKTAADVKYYIQANVDGVWQTVATGDTVAKGISSFEVALQTDFVRVIYSKDELAPDINKITVSAIEESGDTSFIMDYSVNIAGKTANVELFLGGDQTLDNLIVKTNSDFMVMAYKSDNKLAFAKIGSAEISEFPLDGAVIKTMKLQFNNVTSIPAIEEFSVNIRGLSTYFLSERYSSYQKTSAASGNISILGTPYANSNYPGMSYEKYICDGKRSESSPVWLPKLEDFSAGKEIVCGIKLNKAYEVNKIAVHSVDVGNPDGVGSKFEIQALVNGEYVKISDGYTCADKGVYMTVYEIAQPVVTNDIRLVFTNSGIHFPTVLELEIYSSSETPAPFLGMQKGWNPPAVTVFKSEQPRFEVAGLPKK